jgi:hypothetical protein
MTTNGWPKEIRTKSTVQWVVEMYHYDTALCKDTCGSFLAHLGMSFLSVFSKQAPVSLVGLRLFLGNSEKNIFAFPSLEFHVPSK